MRPKERLSASSCVFTSSSSGNSNQWLPFMEESLKTSDWYKRGVAISSNNRHTLHTFLRSFLANCMAFQDGLDFGAFIKKI
jgi:hypothetical protein